MFATASRIIREYHSIRKKRNFEEPLFVTLYARKAIFYLEPSDVKNLSFVSKKIVQGRRWILWNERIKTNIHQKTEEIFRRQNAQYRMLEIDRENGILCYAFQPRIRAEDRQAPSFTCELWGIKKREYYKKYSLEGNVTELSFGSPYLASSDGKKIAVRDVTLKLFDPIIEVDGGESASFEKVLVNRHALSFINKNQLHVVRIRRGAAIDNHTQLLLDYHKNGTTIMQGKLLIYSSTRGVLKIRNLVEKNHPLLGEIIPPGWNERMVEMGQPKDSARVTSMATEGATLVTLSQEEILICNLEDFEVKRVLRFDRSYLNLQLVVSSTIFIHTVQNTIIAIDFDGGMLHEWRQLYEEDEDRDHSRGLVGYHEGQFYISDIGGDPLVPPKCSIKTYKYF